MMMVMCRSNLACGFVVASSAGVIYDWALTFGQEIELVWRQQWSLMTLLYLSVRYFGIVFVVINIMYNAPTISMTDTVSLIVSIIQNWINVVATVIIGVIMVVRLRAVYRGSRKVMIFLIITFLAVIIIYCVFAVIATSHLSGEELILSCTYRCYVVFEEGHSTLMYTVTWILITAWEVVAVCLTAWVAVKHFRELRRRSGRDVVEDSLAVLMESHVAYFASFVAASCLELGYLSPAFSTPHPNSLGPPIYAGVASIFSLMQLFVLGPRLILCIREHYARVEAESYAATGMSSIVFQERVHVQTSNSV
ncbi:hypothetical protein BDR06DRAFT_1022668 [Suillus hirtellus]|nr:hypothetical protein BDR06DRAFT_1022668 [Suillus hirtellus]